MADHLVLVKCDRLELGMYVAELDRSWLHTPFAKHGFLIAQHSQIDILQRCCNYVYVDTEQSESGLLSDTEVIDNSPQPDTEYQLNAMPHGLSQTRSILHAVAAQVAATVRTARRHGTVDIGPIKQRIDLLIDSVLSNPDAPQLLMSAEPTPGFLNRRSLGTATLCIVFGRHLGLDRKELENLALGGVLLDIGKIAVPIPILVKPKHLNASERSFVNCHVNHGLSLVTRHSSVPERVVEMVHGHHERLDGSGYPRQIGGSEIPLYARIAGIVDTFDALTLNRRYAAARSAHSALRFLHTMRDIKFDSAIVDEFVRALGIFPTGTCVELADKSIGLVFSQNTGRPKRPNVLLTADSSGRPIKTFRILETGVHARIARTLPPNRITTEPVFTQVAG
jgi:hypothetical protein